MTYGYGTSMMTGFTDSRIRFNTNSVRFAPSYNTQPHALGFISTNTIDLSQYTKAKAFCDIASTAGYNTSGYTIASNDSNRVVSNWTHIAGEDNTPAHDSYVYEGNVASSTQYIIIQASSNASGAYPVLVLYSLILI